MLKVSKGNTKLGYTYNINMPAGITCNPLAPCQKQGCYAKKGTYSYGIVKRCYMGNLEAFNASPAQAEQDILLQLPFVDSQYFTLFCRWHSSGDIVNDEYFKMIISIANKRPYMRFMLYTKKYDIVNRYIDTHSLSGVPANLVIIFSHWKGFPLDNPYNLPLALVEGLSDISTQGFNCTGSCELCRYCWHMKQYDKVIFHKH